jgi:hypothetical protein
MGDKSGLRQRERTIGLFVSDFALIAVAVTVFADNDNAGFGRIVTHGEQTFLLVLTTLLFAAQSIVFHGAVRKEHSERQYHQRACCGEAKWLASRLRSITE